MEEGVAPTDSRLRPDQRLMELGRWDEANLEKERLEVKQRRKRKAWDLYESGGKLLLINLLTILSKSLAFYCNCCLSL